MAGIPMTELARRLCVDAHAVQYAPGTPGTRTVPCSEHIQMASRVFGLIQPEGLSALKVVAQAAIDNDAAVR